MNQAECEDSENGFGGLRLEAASGSKLHQV